MSTQTLSRKTKDQYQETLLFFWAKCSNSGNWYYRDKALSSTLETELTDNEFVKGGFILSSSALKNFLESEEEPIF